MSIITSTFETYVDVFEGNEIIEHFVEVEVSSELLNNEVVDNVRINTIYSLDKEKSILQKDLTKLSKEVLNNRAYNSLLDRCDELVVSPSDYDEEWYD